MRHRAWISAAAATLALSLFPAFPASGSHHGPPRTTLRKQGDFIQRGRLGSYCWTTGTRAECRDVAGYSWPRARDVRWGGRARIRIRQRRQPTRLSLRAWRRVRRNGEPIGRGMRLHYRLVPHRAEGRIVARDAVFRLPRAERHFYIEAFGRWDLPNSGGDATYWFHIKTRSNLPVPTAGQPR